MLYNLKPVGYTRQQTKQRIQEQSTCILLYNMLYYFFTLICHEITTKSFTHNNYFIIYDGVTYYSDKYNINSNINSTYNNFININSKKLKS